MPFWVILYRKCLCFQNKKIRYSSSRDTARFLAFVLWNVAAEFDILVKQVFRLDMAQPLGMLYYYSVWYSSGTIRNC